MYLKLIILALLTGLMTSTSAQTVFVPGDIMLVAINANNGCGASSGSDDLSFLSFKDITTGTTFDITDNGWERANSNRWATTEGVLRITRTGNTIPAGTVFTLRVVSNSHNVIGIYPDNNWSSVSLNGANNYFNMNTNGDQLFIMQGGVWNAPGQHQGTYSGTILFGFSTNNGWTPFTGSDLGTGESAMYPGMLCLSLAPTAESDYNKYTGATSATNQRAWITRVSDPSNWTAYANCNAFQNNGPQYQNGITFGITVEGFRSGYWFGSLSSDWFNCENWENMLIPDATTDVLIRPNNAIEGPFNDAIIDNSDIAIAHSIDIQNGATAFIQPGGELQIEENLRNNGIFNISGAIVLQGNQESLIWGEGGLSVQQLTLNKSGGAAIQADTLVTIKANGQLIFSSGILTPTGLNRVDFENNATVFGASNNGFVNGMVRKTGNQNFQFPVGDDGFFQPIGIENIATAGSIYEARFLHQNGPGTYSYNWEPSITNVATCNYWLLEKLSGSTARVRLSWGNDDDCEINAPTDLVVSRYNGAMWVNHWQQSITGNAAAGTVLSSDLITQSGPFALASTSNQNPLPVTWLQFEAIQKNHSVALNWSTASETNNDYFAVEHSTDGFFFRELARLSGAGNSSQELNYSWVHQRPGSGHHYYRIRQVDFNGQYSQSEIRHVKIDHRGLYQLELTDGWLRVITAKDVSDAAISIYDPTGRLVFHEDATYGKRFEISLNALSVGIYILKFQSAGMHFTERFYR